MKVIDVEMLRDGGTILLTVEGAPCAGRYSLVTPWRGEPRRLLRDDRPLEVGATEEAALLAALERWFDETSTPELEESLEELDRLKEWLNLPPRLTRAVPRHRVRMVIRCLRERAVSSPA